MKILKWKLNKIKEKISEIDKINNEIETELQKLYKILNK